MELQNQLKVKFRWNASSYDDDVATTGGSVVNAIKSLKVNFSKDAM